MDPQTLDGGLPTATLHGEVAGPGSTFVPGQILGERYRVESVLGRGGMGEVFKAYDLKLRVDVALKALLRDSSSDEASFELIRREVRSAREVISPNVCRIFDLAEADGHELVSMEYVDGETLLSLLRSRGPLEPREAGKIAAQFLAGLEAIHRAGLVHRDVKPENIMITRAGRVVLMDFGIATRKADGVSGLRVGTPAYMSPEQDRGDPVDARTDVYAAGLVLAELTCAEGLSDDSTRQTLWKALRHDPPAIPEGPWRRIVTRAVAMDADERYDSAAALARALEEVVFRVEGAEDKTPYPGLSSFTESDAEFFFGREAEVESVWKKLDRAHLLGIIGASGSGKSSFVRAGLLSAKPDGWGHVICQPGNAPFAALGRALLPELKHDEAAIGELIGLEDLDVAQSAIGRWRDKHDDVLLIVDQFEELFTQNSPEVQSRFAELLGRIALDTGVRILLSMRDDFLIQCNKHESLKPLFSELTALDPPTGADLRRALIQPALACGYRFSDEAMVEEMLGEVTKERGALPLIAFTMAQLWEQRDRETGYLTREAYDAMGGVGGALARHAEATLAQIGEARRPIVREFFRNLVTAQGTRATRDVEELLSIFVVSEVLQHESGTAGPSVLDARSTASVVLQALIDARLLTSFEVRGEEGDGVRRRVEIIHESLLGAWPRLVRWQTQDAEGAQLRDELRQAADVWDKHGRQDDMLWTGTAFREFELWRERYPGGLTSTEEAFVGAMTALAERRTRRRRIIVSSTIAALLIVAGAIAGLWWQAVLEGRRADAANLFSLAKLRHEDHPTAAVAYATASLELADSPETRRLIVEALSRGPMELRLPSPGLFRVGFSPDGRWLATGGTAGRDLIWPSDGGPPTEIESPNRSYGEPGISPRGDLIAYLTELDDRTEFGLSSFPDGRFLRAFEMGGDWNQIFRFSADGARLITTTEFVGAEHTEAVIRSWPVEGGEPAVLARIRSSRDSSAVYFNVDPTESLVAWADGNRFHLAPLSPGDVKPVPTASLEHDHAITTAVFDGAGRQLATVDERPTIKVWSLERDPPTPTHTFTQGGAGTVYSIAFDSSGSMLRAGRAVWDLDGPPDAEPLWLERAPGAVKDDIRPLGYGGAFHPTGRWVVTGHMQSMSFWPLARRYPQILRGHEKNVREAVFTPDGEYLISSSGVSVRVWPLKSGRGERSRVAFQHTQGPMRLTGQGMSLFPDGSGVTVGDHGGRVWIVPLNGGPARQLTAFKAAAVVRVAVSPDSRLVAAGGFYVPTEAVVRVWDLATGETRTLDVGDGAGIRFLRFSGSRELLVLSGSRLRSWDLNGSSPRLRRELELPGEFRDLSPDGRMILFTDEQELWLHDLDTLVSRKLTSHGSDVKDARFGPTREIVASASVGLVRVGRVGAEPHLLVGRGGPLAFSPDGRWLATGGESITLWPMPDLSEPPLHTLPRDELLAKLRSLTNLRALRDPDANTGWSLMLDPFPGWDEVPTW